MFAGHLGAGLALKGRCKGVSLGALFFAAMLPDVVLWALALGGVESVRAPAGYRTAADLTFEFPFSHSLVSSLALSLTGAVVCWWLWGDHPSRARAALVVASAVFSHFVLDWLVHIPEMPVLGNDSPKLGLGLWRHLTLAWIVEGSLAFAGLWLFLRSACPARGKKGVLISVMVLVMVMTVFGQARQAPPPTPTQMAVSALIAIAVLIALGAWIDRRNGG